MLYTVEQLVNNTKPTEFKFLTPIKDVINKKYNNILSNEKLTREHLRKIVQEVAEENTLAKYANLEEIKIISKFSGISHSSDKKLSLVEGAIVAFYNELSLEGHFSRRDMYSSRRNELKLDEIFVVNDLKAAEEYTLDLLIKAEATRIENIKKQEEKAREDLKKNSALATKYGIKGKIDYDNRAKIEFLEAFDSKATPAEKFKALSRVMDCGGCGCDCCCDDW